MHVLPSFLFTWILEMSQVKHCKLLTISIPLYLSLNIFSNHIYSCSEITHARWSWLHFKILSPRASYFWTESVLVIVNFHIVFHKLIKLDTVWYRTKLIYRVNKNRGGTVQCSVQIYWAPTIVGQTLTIRNYMSQKYTV